MKKTFTIKEAAKKLNIKITTAQNWITKVLPEGMKPPILPQKIGQPTYTLNKAHLELLRFIEAKRAERWSYAAITAALTNKTPNQISEGKEQQQTMNDFIEDLQEKQTKRAKKESTGTRVSAAKEKEVVIPIEELEVLIGILTKTEEALKRTSGPSTQRSLAVHANRLGILRTRLELLKLSTEQENLLTAIREGR